MIIIKNWLEEDLANFLENKLIYETPHFYGQTSTEDSKNFFYFTDLNTNESIIQFLMYKIQKSLNKNLHFPSPYMNVQHPSMDGIFHRDDGTKRSFDYTCLYMVTGEGDFEIKDEKRIKFEKNKLVVFDPSKLHKGHAPKKGIRITLAFKAKQIGEKNDK